MSAIAFFAASADGNSSEIKVMPSDGRNAQPIPNTSDAATLTWSPDGKRFAFVVHYGDSDWSIYVVNADGSNLQRLTQGQLDYNPRWSPDGTQIAFIRKGNLWVARISNDPKPVMSDLRQLTTDPKECIWSLDWSPDGTQILFGAQMGTPHGESDYDDPFSAEIYVIRADGSNLRKLTNNKVIDFWPGWSPDGKQIVFSSNRDGDPRYTIKDVFSSKREGSFQIYVMNADGQNVRRLTNTTANDFSPAWSPDGKKIAFSSNRDGNFEIYTMNADGSQPVRLTELPTLDLYPVWKPVPAPVVLKIPQGKPPVLDGLMSPGEWDGALRQKFTDGGELLLMQDGNYLYLGVHESTNAPALTLASVCFAQGDQVSILHSSGALGTAIFKRDNAEWQVTQTFKWELSNLTALTAEANQQRQAFLQKYNWVANIGSMTKTKEFEYKIAIPKGPFQLAVAYPSSPVLSTAAWWPANLADDCRQIKLIQGDSGQETSVPLRLKFSPETWATITIP